MWDPHRPCLKQKEMGAVWMPHTAPFEMERDGGQHDFYMLPPFETERDSRQHVGFTLPLFKTQGAACRIHAAPNWNRRKQGWHVAFMLPFKTEGNENVWQACHPCSKGKKMGDDVWDARHPCSKWKETRNNMWYACCPHSKWKKTEGGMWHSRCPHLYPRCFPHPPCSPLLCVLAPVPSPRSSSPTHWFWNLHPSRRGEAARVMRDGCLSGDMAAEGGDVASGGRWQGWGWQRRVSSAVMLCVGFVSSHDMASGGHHWRWRHVCIVTWRAYASCSTMSSPCLAQMGTHRGTQWWQWQWQGWGWWWWMEEMLGNNVWQWVVAKHCKYY